MKKLWSYLFAVLAALLSLTSCPQVRAQQPEPAKGRFSVDLSITRKGVTLKIDARFAQPEPPTAIDAVNPYLVPAYVDVLLQQMRTAFGQAAGVGESPLERDKRAAQLFEVGEIYRRTGQQTSARTYYQRVHDAAPSSRLGRLAMERIHDIEERLREAEEAGYDDPETSFNDMRSRTIPLGLALPPMY